MRRAWVLLLSLLVVTITCEPPRKPAVFVSLPFIKTTLDPIVKDFVEVIPILDTSVDPFRPPADISIPPETLTRAYQMIHIGGGLDDWLVTLIRKKRGALQSLTTVETPSYVGGSPCVWLSPGDARFWIDNLLFALEKVDKEHMPEFAQNALPIKDELNKFFHDLRWFRIPKGKKTFLQYSSCSALLLLSVGVVHSPPLTDDPTHLPPQEKLTPGFISFVRNLGKSAILVTLTVDNPEGVARIRDLFPDLKILTLKTFPHELSPNASLMDLLSHNTDLLLEADQ
jgi:hypothetical protein